MNKYQLDRAILDAKQGELTNAKWSPLQRLGHFLNDTLYGNTREGQQRADRIVDVIGGTKLPDIAETAYQVGKTGAKIVKDPANTPDALQQLAMLIMPGTLANRLEREGRLGELSDLKEDMTIAKEIFRQGGSAENIRELTGMFNEPFSKRFLIDYDSSKIKFNKDWLKRDSAVNDENIRELVEDDKLFKTVPSLQNTRVNIDQFPSNGWGIYSPSKDMISLNSTPSHSGGPSEETVMHELQHAIRVKTMGGPFNFTNPKRESGRVWDTFAKLNNDYQDGKQITPIGRQFIEEMHRLPNMQERLQMIGNMGHLSYEASPEEQLANYAGDNFRRTPSDRKKRTLNELFRYRLPLAKSYTDGIVDVMDESTYSNALHKPIHMRRLLERVKEDDQKIIPCPE